LSAGHVGKWQIVTQNGAVSETDLQALERSGYEIVSVTSHVAGGGAGIATPKFVIFARYRGGIRMPAGG
jgi:hypothetical protein